MSNCAKCVRKVCDWIVPPENCADFRENLVSEGLENHIGRSCELMVPGLNRPAIGRLVCAEDDFFLFEEVLTGRIFSVDFECSFTLLGLRDER